MVKTWILHLCLIMTTMLGTCSVAMSQGTKIKGHVLDTMGHKSVNQASIVILTAIDSFLVKDTRTDIDGSFIFSSIPAGKYLLLVTHPRYASYVEPFVITNSSENICFNVVLQMKSILLKEVIIGRQKSVAIFKKDTIEYEADSFHVLPGASVEDLLKQLPGLQVDKYGHITANGKDIEKVLVDGEEFFGDDPTLITRNLRAGIVDKVQYYNKQSDKAALTGIDNGKKTPTLNLKLKQEKKNGYFGKIELGGGSKGYYQNEGMFNSFANKRKYAAFLRLSNTGMIGLESRNQQKNNNDNIPVENELDNWNGTYNGNGIPKNISDGIHYDNKWDNESQYINLNYKSEMLDVEGYNETATQNNLPDHIQYGESNLEFHNKLVRHKVNSIYERKLDSSFVLKLSLDGARVNKTVNNKNTAKTSRADQSIINNNESSTVVNATINELLANAGWEKKFKRERRTLSLNFSTALSKNYSDGYFYTVNDFFDTNNILDSVKIVDQYKVTDNRFVNDDLNAIYTEPINKYGSLSVNYHLSMSTAKGQLFTYNKSSDKTYSILDSLYSNIFKINQLAESGSIVYYYSKNKFFLKLGAGIAINKVNQKDLFNSTILKRSFTNWCPVAQINYAFTPAKTISLSYEGNSVQPTIQQLQPLVNNKDPLNIYIGNRNLKPAFSNKLSISYHSFIQEHSGYLGINLHYSSTYRPISTVVKTDYSTGINIYSNENIDTRKAINYFGNFFYSTKTTVWDIAFAVNADIAGASYPSLTNGELNTSKHGNYQVSIVLSKQQNSLYNINIKFGPVYNVNKNTLQSSVKNNFWGYQGSFDIELNLPLAFIINMDGDYKWQGKTQTFTNSFHRFLWNAGIGKKILKDKSILLKLSVNDILNQNIGFDRNISNNLIYENNYTKIAQYFMATAIWNFNKSNGNK